MPAEDVDLPPGRRVPDPHRPVGAGRGQGPVGAERDPVDPAGVPGQGAEVLERRGVPDPDRAVPAPAARNLPSGLNATQLTYSVWSVRVRRSFPVATSQTLTVLSHAAVASRRPSGLKATAPTAPTWAGR